MSGKSEAYFNDKHDYGNWSNEEWNVNSKCEIYNFENDTEIFVGTPEQFSTSFKVSLLEVKKLCIKSNSCTIIHNYSRRETACSKYEINSNSIFRFYSNTDSEVYRGSIKEFCCQYKLDIIEVYKLVERKSPGSLVRHEYKKPRKTYEQSKETYKLSLLDKILDFFNFN